MGGGYNHISLRQIWNSQRKTFKTGKNSLNTTHKQTYLKQEGEKIRCRAMMSAFGHGHTGTYNPLYKVTALLL